MFCFVLFFHLNHIRMHAIFYSVFLCSECFRATDRRKRFPKKNVIMANGISRRSVSNIFNCNQNRPNRARMAPKLKKKPIPLKLNEKFDRLMPIFVHKKNNTKSGTAQSIVKTSDTTRGGRFSG